MKSNWIRLFGLARTPPALGPRMGINLSCDPMDKKLANN